MVLSCTLFPLHINWDCYRTCFGSSSLSVLSHSRPGFCFQEILTSQQFYLCQCVLWWGLEYWGRQTAVSVIGEIGGPEKEKHLLMVYNKNSSMKLEVWGGGAHSKAISQRTCCVWHWPMESRCDWWLVCECVPPCRSSVRTSYWWSPTSSPVRRPWRHGCYCRSATSPQYQHIITTPRHHPNTPTTSSPQP